MKRSRDNSSQQQQYNDLISSSNNSNNDNNDSINNSDIDIVDQHKMFLGMFQTAIDMVVSMS